MENPDIVKLYGDLLEEEAIARARAGGHLSQEQIKKLTDEFLKKNATRRLSDDIKVETVVDDKSGDEYSWKMKITFPAGLLDPEVEEELRRNQRELEEKKPEAERPEG